jgi:hypothetical protein
MSFTALNWAWEQNCSSGVAKSVLVYLANCASQEGGDCFPSIPTICQRTQHTDLAVRKALKQLVAADLLEIEPRTLSNGRQTSNLYRLPVVSIQPTPSNSQGSEDAIYTPSNPQGSEAEYTPSISRATPETDPGGGGADSRGNPSERKDREEREERTSLAGGSACAHATTPAAGSNVVVLRAAEKAAIERDMADAWNAMAVDRGLPAVRGLTRDRRKKLELRIASVGVDGMLEAIEKVRASAFCAGENDRGWVAGFDFLLQPKTLTKLLEGSYDNRPAVRRARTGSHAAFEQKLGLRPMTPTFDPEPVDNTRRIGQ